MDSKTVIVSIITVMGLLVAAVYKEPKAYRELMAPVLKWLSLGVLTLGAGAVVGFSMGSSAVLGFVPDAQLQEAKAALSESQAVLPWAMLTALAIFVFDIALYVIAEKSEKWKAAKAKGADD